jgi:hypothetical protein
VSTLNRLCSNNSSGGYDCPTSKQSEVNGARDAALIEGPLGIGLAVGAAVSLGVGVWLLASTPSNGVHVTPVVTQHGAAIVFGGAIDR